jgi:hypothetical protein
MENEEEFELDNQFKVGEYEIEVVDTRPEEDQRPPADDAAVDDLDAEEEELKNISAGVQKRIDKLTFKFNDERRKAEAAQKLQEEAILFAKTQKEEADKMRAILKEGEGVLVAEVRSRTAADVDRASQNLAAALESGDPIAATEAQKALNKAQIEQHQAESYAVQQVPQAPDPVQQAPIPQQVPQADPLLEGWLRNNQWYESDSRMQAYAKAVHSDLVNQHGPTSAFLGSEAYYKSIDDTMRSAFPDFFGTKGASEPAAGPAPSVVAPAARNNGPGQANSSPRKVQLTDTQVDLAKRLNLPLEVYAREYLKVNGGS